MASLAVSGARLGVVWPGGSARSGGKRRSCRVELPSVVLFRRKNAFSRAARSRFRLPPLPLFLVGRSPALLAVGAIGSGTVLSCAGAPRKVLVVEQKAYSSAAQATSASAEAISSEVEAEETPEPSEVIEGTDETDTEAWRGGGWRCGAAVAHGAMKRRGAGQSPNETEATGDSLDRGVGRRGSSYSEIERCVSFKPESRDAVPFHHSSQNNALLCRSARYWLATHIVGGEASGEHEQPQRKRRRRCRLPPRQPARLSAWAISTATSRSWRASGPTSRRRSRPTPSPPRWSSSSATTTTAARTPEGSLTSSSRSRRGTPRSATSSSAATTTSPSPRSSGRCRRRPTAPRSRPPGTSTSTMRSTRGGSAGRDTRTCTCRGGAGAGSLRRGGTPRRGSIYDAQPTFESYGVAHGSPDLAKALPEEHKRFLHDLVWIHEEENVPIDTDEGQIICNLIAVHAGLEKTIDLNEQLRVLRTRDTRVPKVQMLSGRQDVWNTPKDLTGKQTIIVSGHHAKLHIDGLRFIIDEGGGYADKPIAAIVFPSKTLIRSTEEAQ